MATNRCRRHNQRIGGESGCVGAGFCDMINVRILPFSIERHL